MFVLTVFRTKPTNKKSCSIILSNSINLTSKGPRK